MKIYLLALAAIIAAHSNAELISVSAATVQSDDLIQSFGFEESTLGKMPAGWNIKSAKGLSASVVDEGSKSGRQSMLLETKSELQDSSSPIPTGALSYKLTADQTRGKRIRLKASIKANFRDESGQVIMWLREDLKTGGTGAFENMMDRPIKSGNWSEHEIVVDISKNVKAVNVGFVTFGNGRVFIDNMVIESVDENVEVTSAQTAGNGGGIDSSPGLFEIVGAMEVRANMPLLKRQKTDDATLLIPLPLRNRSQYPLTFNLSTKPKEALRSFKVFKDKGNNHVAEVVLQNFKQFKRVQLNYDSAVIVLPTEFDDVPESAKVPNSTAAEAKPWLRSTWCVDSKDKRIAEIAKEIRRETDDILEIISKVEQRSKRIFNSAQGNVENLTAVEALDKRGSCTSCGNLVAALLRAAGVPARVLAGYPSWSGPLQTHYIVEAYIPDYGWYPIESTFCRSPWPNQNQINVSIVPPEYESEELAGYRTGVAGGVPYLSLAEIRDNEGLFHTIGKIPEHEYCDHACRLLRKFEADESEWKQAAEWSEMNWQSWLDSDHRATNGTVQFGPTPASLKAESPSALVFEIKNALK